MIEKKNVISKPNVTEKTERVIPPELRKIMEEIERDLARYHSVYSDSTISTNTDTNGSIRI